MNKIKSWEEFLLAVNTMRAYQAEYEKNKIPSVRIKAKEFEALVDGAIKDRTTRIDAKKQVNLFEN